MTTERDKVIADLKAGWIIYRDGVDELARLNDLCRKAADMLAADGAQSESTDAEITELAHRTAWDYEHNAISGSHMYIFTTHTLIDFARKLLAKGGAK